MNVNSMQMLMFIQVTYVTKCFITQTTAIWMLPIMYTLMYLHIP